MSIRCILCTSWLCSCLRYKQEFGFVIPGRKILVDDVRVRGIGRTRVRVEQTIPRATGEPVPDMVGVRAELLRSTDFTAAFKCCLKFILY